MIHSRTPLRVSVEWVIVSTVSRSNGHSNLIFAADADGGNSVVDPCAEPPPGYNYSAIVVLSALNVVAETSNYLFQIKILIYRYKHKIKNLHLF